MTAYMHIKCRLRPCVSSCTFMMKCEKYRVSVNTQFCTHSGRATAGDKPIYQTRLFGLWDTLMVGSGNETYIQSHAIFL